MLLTQNVRSNLAIRVTSEPQQPTFYVSVQFRSNQRSRLKIVLVFFSNATHMNKISDC